MSNRPDRARDLVPAGIVALAVGALGWLLLVAGTLGGGAGTSSLIVSAVTLSALAVGAALLVARRAAVLLGRRPARVPVRRDDERRPMPRAVDPDRPSHSRPRAPGCGQA